MVGNQREAWESVVRLQARLLLMGLLATTTCTLDLSCLVGVCSPQASHTGISPGPPSNWEEMGQMTLPRLLYSGFILDRDYFAYPVSAVLPLKEQEEGIFCAITLVVFSHSCAGQPYCQNDLHSPHLRLARHWLSNPRPGLGFPGLLRRYGCHRRILLAPIDCAAGGDGLADDREMADNGTSHSASDRGLRWSLLSSLLDWIACVATDSHHRNKRSDLARLAQWRLFLDD